MDKNKEILEIKKDFIKETIYYERIMFLAFISFLLGFLTKGFFDKAFNNLQFLTLAIVLIIVLVLGEFIIEFYRQKKYNELKEETERDLLSRKIRIRPY